jgi:hypothetical protein
VLRVPLAAPLRSVRSQASGAGWSHASAKAAALLVLASSLHRYALQTAVCASRPLSAAATRMGVGQVRPTGCGAFTRSSASSVDSAKSNIRPSPRTCRQTGARPLIGATLVSRERTILP